MNVNYLHLILFKLNMKTFFYKVVKFLNEMEQRWVAEQNKLKLKQIKEKKGSVRAEASQTV